MLLDMYKTKIEHPEAGASCAWVPSPSGAVIHAIHYHQCNVSNRQQELLKAEALSLDDLLTPPLATDTNWSEEDKIKELENNLQRYLGLCSALGRPRCRLF